MLSMEAKEAPASCGAAFAPLPSGQSRQRSKSFHDLCTLSEHGAKPLAPFAGPCGVCGRAAPYRCASCNEVFYCSRDHQRAGWAEHRKVCAPNPKAFRYKTPKPAVAAATAGSGTGALPGAATLVGYQNAHALDAAQQASMDADECSICYNEYQRGGHADPDRLPRRLPCSHVFCGGCLGLALAVADNCGGDFKCPCCFRQVAKFFVAVDSACILVAWQWWR